MPMHLKGGFKSKNGLVTYGDGGAYGAGPAAKRMMKKASKGLEALATANPELTYKKKAMYGTSMDPKYIAEPTEVKARKKMKKAMYGTSMKPKRR